MLKFLKAKIINDEYEQVFSHYKLNIDILQVRDREALL
jgi:hypothetical protein